MEEFNISRKKKVALCQNENQFSLPRLSTDVDVMQQINRSEIAEQTVQRWKFFVAKQKQTFTFGWVSVLLG